ncbi:FixH family protein [Rossellomorea vietnamensis]|uniref:FixH family protein n=1 Tax=Rossellomorea vietnamensis TaxID=218284 RepID=A0ACD4CBM8_9BACI|nr:FixH family protein [Rossellomorea vietnamensis]UXH45826.1 FixH family protein [Rossellomorea vietnamensis]
MKKISLFMLVGFLALVIAACGNSNEDNGAKKDEKLEAIDAKLDVPEKGEKGEPVSLSTKVTKGDENVDDAGEVKYEIWKNGHKDESEMIEAKHEKGGLYKAEKTFQEDGLYTVQVHVTARDMHTMPKTEIAIGEVGAGEHEEAGEDHHHGDHESTVSIHLMKPDSITAGEEAEMKVHVENKEAALEDARVRFEIYQDGQEKHEWVDLTPDEAGKYSGSYTFPEKGSYNVQVHVTKGEEIHEHSMETVDVQ